eukprot:IDg6600t1
MQKDTAWVPRILAWLESRVLQRARAPGDQRQDPASAPAQVRIRTPVSAPTAAPAAALAIAFASCEGQTGYYQDIAHARCRYHTAAATTANLHK